MTSHKRASDFLYILLGMPAKDMAIRVYSAKSKALLSTLPPPPNSKVHEFPLSKTIGKTLKS